MLVYKHWEVFISQFVSFQKAKMFILAHGINGNQLLGKPLPTLFFNTFDCTYCITKSVLLIFRASTNSCAPPWRMTLSPSVMWCGPIRRCAGWQCWQLRRCRTLKRRWPGWLQQDTVNSKQWVCLTVSPYAFSLLQHAVPFIMQLWWKPVWKRMFAHSLCFKQSQYNMTKKSLNTFPSKLEYSSYVSVQVYQSLFYVK